MAEVNPQDRYRCPRCRLSDRVEKAEVSQKVEPPRLPSFSTPLVYESPWGCFSVGYVIASSLAFLFFAYVFIGNLSSPIGNPWQGPGQIFFITLALVIIAIFVMIHHTQKANTDRAEVARHNAEQSARIEASQKRYKHEKDIYDQLYYCGRDNVAFILNRPETCVPAAQVDSLYETL